MPTTKVFVSSTLSDAQVSARLSQAPLPEGVSLDTAPAGPAPVRQASLLALDRCQAFLGVLGPRFGAAQALELRRAEERNLPRAIVVQADAALEQPVSRLLSRAESQGTPVRRAANAEELASIAEELLQQLGAQALAAIAPPPAPEPVPEPAPTPEPEPVQAEASPFAAPAVESSPFAAPVASPFATPAVESSPFGAPVQAAPLPEPVLAPPPVAEPAPVQVAPVQTAPVVQAQPAASAPVTEPAVALPHLPGRGALLAEIVSALTPGSRVALDGPDGLGKTTLARAAAQALASRFPEGVFWVDASGRGLVAAENRLGWAIGEDVSIEHNRPARLERLKVALERRRALLVLDDVSDQSLWSLLGLLPQGAVLLTARELPQSLKKNARTFDIKPLNQAEGVEVAQALAAGQSAEQAQALAKLCGGSPLAIAIAAAVGQAQRLTAAQLQTGISGEAAENRAEAVARFALTQLSDAHRTVFAAAGVIPSPSFPTGAAAAAAEIEPGQAEGLLRELAARQLLQAVAAGRFQIPAALRPMARALVAATGTDAKASTFYSALAQAHKEVARQHLDALEEDREGLLLSARALHTKFKELPPKKRGFFSRIFGGKPEKDERQELSDAIYDLEYNASTFLNVRGYWEDWKELNKICLEVSREMGDAKREATYFFQLGSVQRLERDFSGARASLTEAIQKLEAIGDRATKAQALHNLALLSIEEKKNKEALSLLDQAISNADEKTAATWTRLKQEIEASLRGK